MMINVAMLSKWHVHAVDYAREANENKHIHIKVVWDEKPDRGKKWADELGVEFEPDLLNVLKDPTVDAVIVDTPTNLHKEVIILAAQHKKHIFSEKVLALTVDDCREIFAAVKEHQVKLMLSLPRLTSNYYLYAQQIVDEGLLGQLTSIRCRCAHNGAVPFDDHAHGWLPKHFFNKEECGGGALIDLGAHPIYLTNRLAGDAKAVTARLQKTLGHDVEDNAVVLVEYESGALGTIETSFVSHGSPFQLELYGTEGCLLLEETKAYLNCKKLGEKHIKAENMPASLQMPLEQWAEYILFDKIPSITVADMERLTLINELATESSQQNCRIEVNR